MLTFRQSPYLTHVHITIRETIQFKPGENRTAEVITAHRGFATQVLEQTELIDCFTFNPKYKTIEGELGAVSLAMTKVSH